MNSGNLLGEFEQERKQRRKNSILLAIAAAVLSLPILITIIVFAYGQFSSDKTYQPPVVSDVSNFPKEGISLNRPVSADNQTSASEPISNNQSEPIVSSDVPSYSGDSTLSYCAGLSFEEWVEDETCYPAGSRSSSTPQTYDLSALQALQAQQQAELELQQCIRDKREPIVAAYQALMDEEYDYLQTRIGNLSGSLMSEAQRQAQIASLTAEYNAAVAQLERERDTELASIVCP